MEERELTQLLQRLGDRVTPGPAPTGRIMAQGGALRGRRSGRARMFAVAAAAAAVVGGGSVAAVVLDLPSVGGSRADSAAGGAAGAEGEAGGGEDTGPQAESRGEDSAASADTADLVVTPDLVAPGQTVRLAVPPDVAFRVNWSLDRRVGSGWVVEFVLVDAAWAEENGAALSRPADSPQGPADMPEVQDGPVPLVVPAEAAPGSYRICQTVDAGTAWCGELTVTD